MKTLISTLFLGASLVLSGCGNNIQEAESKKVEQKSEYLAEFVKGKIIDEAIAEKTFGNKCRVYIIIDKENKEHSAVIRNINIDPFNIGDSIQVKLGKIALYYPNEYIEGKLVEGKKGYEIFEYKLLKQNKK